jgi:hypothetical protein
MVKFLRCLVALGCAAGPGHLISLNMKMNRCLFAAVLLATVAGQALAQGAETDAPVADPVAVADPVVASGAGVDAGPGADPETAPKTAPDSEPDAAPPTEIIQPAGDTTLAEWLWVKRPVVVFADSPIDPRFIEQMALIEDRLDAFVERDVVVLTDTDPAARSPLRQKLRPHGFMLVVIAKDGTIVTRKPRPWSVREISRSIDKLPLRQQEVRDR